MKSVRKISKVWKSKPTIEGAGVHLKRAFGISQVPQFDPFLMLDDFHSSNPADYLPGFPWHPHRGIETITYVQEGLVEHGDSIGNKGVIAAGDVQWMTAGSGVVHSELPSDEFMRDGGVMHGFQIWVNLPARDKMMPPRYQEIPAARIPQATSADGKVTVRVIAGSALGVSAVIETRTPIHYLHFTIQPGGELAQPVPAGDNALVYLISGNAQVGHEHKRVREGQMARLGDGDVVPLAVPAEADGPAELLLLAGTPLNEPVARYGPFVMNTRSEIEQAIRDYESGRMGRIDF